MNNKDLQLLQEAAEKITNSKLQAFKDFADKHINFEKYIKDIVEKGYEITSMEVDKDLYMSFFPTYMEDIRHNANTFHGDLDWYYEAPTDRIQNEYEGIVHMKLYDNAINDTIDEYGGYPKFKKDWQNMHYKEGDQLLDELADKAYSHLLSFYRNADETDFKGVFRDSVSPER